MICVNLFLTAQVSVSLSWNFSEANGICTTVVHGTSRYCMDGQAVMGPHVTSPVSGRIPGNENQMYVSQTTYHRSLFFRTMARWCPVVILEREEGGHFVCNFSGLLHSFVREHVHHRLFMKFLFFYRSCLLTRFAQPLEAAFFYFCYLCTCCQDIDEGFQELSEILTLRAAAQQGKPRKR